MKKIKGILFDMDGVLIDAKDWHYHALNQALSLFGLEISRYEHIMTYDGLPTKKKLEMLTVERGLPKKLHGFINKLKQKNTTTMIHNHCCPNFIHEYALSKLSSEGYQMAVCSNSIRNTIELMMNYSSLDKYFEFYMSNEDVIKCKPHPEIYSKAMEKLSLNPEETLILEDNENGLKAAKSSGAHVLRIGSVNDVNYDNISSRIKLIEGV